MIAVRAPVLSIAVAAGLLIAGGARTDEIGTPGTIDVRTRVAILPMVVNSIGEQGYLRGGLSDMLASRLGRNLGVAVIRIETESEATTDPARAAAIGLESGARYVVFGSFTQFGEGASLDVQCLDVKAFGQEDSPGARRVFIQAGTVSDIIPKLDEMAQKIGLYVAAPAAGPATGAPSVGTAPTVAPGAPAAGPETADAEALQDLRRRLGAIEEYLFGDKTDGATTSELDPDASQDLGLR